MRRAASIILTCGMSNGFGCSSSCSAELVPTAGIEPARLKQARDFKAVGNPPESRGRLQNGPSTAHGIPPHSDPPAKRNAPAEAGTKAGAKEIIKAATIGENSTGHRLFLQVRQHDDGWRVELHGACGGYLLTIARGLDLNNAVMRAGIEAEARGIEVRA